MNTTNNYAFHIDNLGTPCGPGKWCYEGRCVLSDGSGSGAPSAEWSSWSSGPCKSACIRRSKGFRRLTRSCIIRSNSNQGHSKRPEKAHSKAPKASTVESKTIVETRLESDFAWRAGKTSSMLASIAF